MPDRDKRETGYDSDRIIPLPPRPDFADPAWLATAENCATVVLSKAGRYRYARIWSRWFRYEKGRWAWDETATLERLIGDTLVEIAVGKKSKLRARLESLSMISLIERRLRSLLPATSEQWDRGLFLFNTPAGSIELQYDTSLREHRREDYCTRMAAVGPKGDCPLWREHLEFITCGDADLISYLQRAVGYTLTGSVEEQCLFFLFGTGDNGKGVFINTLTGILGDYAQTAAMETFTKTRNERHPEELAVLKGVRMVTASETESGKAWTEARVKLLTGGDKIRAHLMRQDSFEYLPQFKIWISGNHRPTLSSTDPAIKRRLQVIPFNNHVDEEHKDRQRGERLKAEWPGIMAWAVEGCRLWREGGLRPPSAVVSATDEYIDAEDLIAAWLEQETAPTGWTKSNELYVSWKKFAEAAGEWPGSAKRLSEELKSRRYLAHKYNGARGFKGISIRPKSDDEQNGERNNQTEELPYGR